VLAAVSSPPGWPVWVLQALSALLLGVWCVWHVVVVFAHFDEEVFPNGIVTPLAGVIEAGEAVVRHSLK
jgi:succinate dehydrogenase hydrophobic anchor subunit